MQKSLLAFACIASLASVVACGDAEYQPDYTLSVTSPSIDEGVMVVRSGRTAVIRASATVEGLDFVNAEFDWQLFGLPSDAIDARGSFAILSVGSDVREDLVAEILVRLASAEQDVHLRMPILVVAH